MQKLQFDDKTQYSNKQVSCTDKDGGHSYMIEAIHSLLPLLYRSCIVCFEKTCFTRDCRAEGNLLLNAVINLPELCFQTFVGLFLPHTPSMKTEFMACQRSRFASRRERKSKSPRDSKICQVKVDEKINTALEKKKKKKRVS